MIKNRGGGGHLAAKGREIEATALVLAASLPRKKITLPNTDFTYFQDSTQVFILIRSRKDQLAQIFLNINIHMVYTRDDFSTYSDSDSDSR